MKCAAVVGYAQKRIAILNFEVAPEVGLEPTTYWLTVNSPIHITPVFIGWKAFRNCLWRTYDARKKYSLGNAAEWLEFNQAGAKLYFYALRKERHKAIEPRVQSK